MLDHTLSDKVTSILGHVGEWSYYKTILHLSRVKSVTKVGFIYTFWYFLSSTSSLLEQRLQSVYHLEMTKAVTYDERPKMKRDIRQKGSPFLRKKSAFLSLTSLHFRPFVLRYSFSLEGFQHHFSIISSSFQNLFVAIVT